MHAQPDVENIEDFSRYYRGAYVLFEVDGAYVPARISEASARLNAVTFQTYRRAPDGLLNVTADSVPWAEYCRRAMFGVPDLGMREYRESVAYFYIFPERHWGRGYQPAHVHTEAFNIAAAAQGLGGTHVDTRGASAIYDVLCPTFRTAADALRLLEAGDRVGCAIDRNVGLYTVPNSEDPYIAFRRRTAGFVRDGAAFLYRAEAPEAIRRLVGQALNMRTVIV